MIHSIPFSFEDKDLWTIINEYMKGYPCQLSQWEIKYADLSKGIHRLAICLIQYIKIFIDSYIYPLDDSHFAINRDEGFFIFNLDTISGVIAIKGEPQLSELRVFQF